MVGSRACRGPSRCVVKCLPSGRDSFDARARDWEVRGWRRGAGVYVVLPVAANARAGIFHACGSGWAGVGWVLCMQGTLYVCGEVFAPRRRFV